MIRTNVHLSDKQLDQLRALSSDTGLTVAEHIRRAIDEYLERQQSADGRSGPKGKRK